MSSPDAPDTPVSTPALAPAGAAASDDVSLLEACRSGSPDAYERLYESQGARMKSIARNLLGSPQDAEDAVQDTFLKIHRGIRNFREQSAFSTWVYRILINSCRDLRRKRMRRQETSQHEMEPDAFPEPAAPGGDHPMRLALEQWVEKLNPQQKAVFVLYEVEGFRHAEIAAMLSLTEASSKNTLYQAKLRLRQMFHATRDSRKAGA